MTSGRRRRQPAWARRSTARREEPSPPVDDPVAVAPTSRAIERREPSAAVAAIVASCLASLLTGLVSVAVMERQLDAQSEQLTVQIEEGRESARTQRRQQRYAEFLGHSAAITAKIDGLGLEGQGIGVRRVEQLVRAVSQAAEEIGDELALLKEEQTELLVFGPSTMALLAWDIVDDQSNAHALARGLEVLKLVPLSGLGAASLDLETQKSLSVRRVRKLLRRTQDRISRNTSELTVAAMLETGGYLAANPDAQEALTKRLNRRNAQRAK